MLLVLQGGRYALLLVVPRSRDGLLRLTADLPAASIADIQDNLREEELQVSLPTFYVETTTKPVAALAKVSGKTFIVLCLFLEPFVFHCCKRQR